MFVESYKNNLYLQIDGKTVCQSLVEIIKVFDSQDDKDAVLRKIKNL